MLSVFTSVEIESKSSDKANARDLAAAIASPSHSAKASDRELVYVEGKRRVVTC